LGELHLSNNIYVYILEKYKISLTLWNYFTNLSIGLKNFPFDSSSDFN